MFVRVSVSHKPEFCFFGLEAPQLLGYLTLRFDGNRRK